MSMLEYNEIVVRKYIIFENEPYEVMASHVFRKQQRKPVNATKLKNLLSGRIVEHSFHSTDKADEADIDSKKIKYLYTNRGEVWFCDEDDASNRFTLSEQLLGPNIKYIKQNSIVDALTFDEKVFALKYPIKVELKVTESVDAVKGNTQGGAQKIVTLETGATITVPLFINQGDIIRINTESGEYTERVTK